MSADAMVVLCTVPSEAVAEELARGLVTRSLAACVNIVPGIRSIYSWQGKLEDGQELLLVIKTRTERYEELERWLTEAHPYEVPEVIALPIALGAPAYLRWVTEQTRPD
jgi:periplasmic divalent cation tolerance protein